jgi:phosphatidylinositol glycan class F
MKQLITRGIPAVWGGGVAFFFLAILLGAPLTKKIHETLLWSSVQASVTILPVFLLHGINLEALWRIFVVGVTKSKTERNIRACGGWSVIGSIIGTAAFPLDWDEPWQEYPIPIVVMCVVGFLVGAVLSFAGLCQRV